MDEYLSQFDHSFSGKDLTPLAKIYAMELSRKIKYYKAHVISHNQGSILSIEGGGYLRILVRLT
jgi:hypothetical protein